MFTGEFYYSFRMVAANFNSCKKNTETTASGQSKDAVYSPLIKFEFLWISFSLDGVTSNLMCDKSRISLTEDNQS